MNSRIDKNIDDALFDFYLNADKETINDVVKDNIQNYEQYSKKKKQIAFITKAIAKQMHNNELLELANQLKDAINKDIEKPISYLKANYQNNFSPMFFRSLESLSKEDIILMIKDNNLIELLEKLEKDCKVD